MLALLLLTILTQAAAQDPGIGPAPGRLVDIGGRRLHLHCTGTGSPTVVVEAGGSSYAIDFSLVQPAIAKTTRVCSYDRAGSGWSEARRDVETPMRVVADLRALLDAAGEKGPFVMVGASRGGVYVRLFQAEYPVDVAGLVLIDPSVEDRLYTMFQGKGVAIPELTAEQYRSLQPPADAVVPIASRQPQTGAPFDRLPKALYETRVAIDRQAIAAVPPTVTGAVVTEFQSGDYAMLSRLLTARRATPASLGDLPLVVLSRGRGGQPDAHAELAKMSRAGRHLVVADSYHEIHLSHPEAVVTAVVEIVEQVRTSQSKASR
jgi:pimeloyl-ACP methyl ester carboxylesterase